MKALLSLIISGALVVSGYSQTRNVLVGTNNTVVQPTNFWSADASNARTGLGLGTAATNPASAFQPSSTILSNLAIGNGTDLTNITATIVGTNVSISNVSGLQAALDGKVATNGSAAGLTNFPSIVLQSNSAITNFPAGLLRTNGDASGLTNFPTVALASNLSTALAINRGGTAATNVSDARLNLGATTIGNAIFTATNTADGRTALGATTIGSSVFTLANPSAVTFLRINADNTASALSASDFRTALSLGTAATNQATNFQTASSALTTLSTNNGANLTNIPVAGVVGALATNGNAAGLTNFPTVALASNVTGTIAISNGGSGATTAGGARTNFGLGNISTNTFQTTNTAVYINTNIIATNGNGIFTNLQSQYLEFTTLFVGDSTNTNIITFEDPIEKTNFLRGIGLGPTDSVSFASLAISNSTNNFVASFKGGPSAFPLEIYTTDEQLETGYGSNNFAIGVGEFGLQIKYGTNSTSWGYPVLTSLGGTNLLQPSNVTNFRSAIGFSLPALTNTNNVNFLAAFFGANTNPVLVNTNGEVVSPTNFWQAAPINTRVQLSQPNGATNNVTNTATNARNLYLYSLTPLVNNVTNTIQLPTNGGTFLGDVATVIHEGPTSSITAVRQTGAGSNLITLNQFQEAVKFIYESGGWRLADNISCVEPIYFSGTNAAENAAASRANLGLGATNVVQLGTIVSPFFYSTSSNAIIELDDDTFILTAVAAEFRQPISFDNTTNAAQTRTNLGLGATNNVTFNDVTASGTLTATSTVTAKTNLVVEGFVNYTAARTNNTPTNTPNFAAHAAWIEVKVGTNSFFLPAYQ